MIGAALQEADRFWAQSVSVNDLPTVIDGLKDFYRTSAGLPFGSYTQHALAVPFVLKHLGKDAEALAVLEKQSVSFWEPEALHRVWELLAK